MPATSNTAPPFPILGTSIIDKPSLASSGATVETGVVSAVWRVVVVKTAPFVDDAIIVVLVETIVAIVFCPVATVVVEAVGVPSEVMAPADAVGVTGAGVVEAVEGGTVVVTVGVVVDEVVVVVGDGVGAVVSMVTGKAVEAEAGPLPLALVTLPLFMRSTTVPSDVHSTDTVMDEPVEDEGVKTHPVAVPMKLTKSVEAIPETLRLKLKPYDNVRDAEGEAGTDVHVAVSTKESTVIVLTDGEDKLSNASTAYTLYVPSTRPEAIKVVLVLAVEIVT